MIRFTVPIPPSVNEAYRSFRGRNILSRKGREWYKSVVQDIRSQVAGNFVIGPCAVTYEYTFADNRRRDIFNYEKLLSDAITKAHVWNDDSQISDGRVIRLPVDKNNPHCDVYIEAL